jgi:hypothetical protein
MDLSPDEIPQRLLRQLFELDGDYAEALWAPDQPEGSPDRRAMLCDTVKSLDQLAPACARFRQKLAARTHPASEQLGSRVRLSLKTYSQRRLQPKTPTAKDAHSMVPGRDPENV